MFYFVLVGVLAVVFLVGLSMLVLGSEKAPGAFTTGIAAILIVLVTVLFSATTVSARSVGVETSFGRYQGTLQSGLHWTAPWAGVEEFSTQIQPLSLEGDHTVSVSFMGGGQGAVDATVRWYIDTENAQTLWQKYRTFENVRDQLVNSSAKDSFRVVFGRYSPNDARSGENLRAITDAITSDLGNTLSKYGVKVDSVSVQRISLDEATQASLEKVVVANNDIVRAQSEQQRAIIDAKTAEIRQKSGSLSGPALIRYCLDVTNAWDVKKNGNLPSGWNCFSSSPFVNTK